MMDKFALAKQRGKELQNYRKSQGLTQKQLATLAGYKQALSVSWYETAGDHLSFRTMSRFAKAFGVAITDIWPNEKEF